MTEPDLLTARFPGVPLARGHYESCYLKASHPTEPLGLWIRFTVRKPPGVAPIGSVWVTLFEADGPTAVKVNDADLSIGPNGLVGIGSSRISLDGTAGAAGAVSWNLGFSQAEPLLAHLPAPWMYAAALPRTKSASPLPALTLSGSATIGGRTISLDGWHGMLGHNWGSEHAHRWIWLQGSGFADSPDTWLDVVLGRLRIGPITTPWLASGMVSLDGVRHRVGGPARMLATKVAATATGAEITLPGQGVCFGVRVAAPLQRFVGWRYADPAGAEHQVRNCSIAELTLIAGERTLRSPHGATYELGTPEFDPDLPMQLYADS